jgi:hypothetical protein
MLEASVTNRILAVVDDRRAVALEQALGLGPRRAAVADPWFFIESGLTLTTICGAGSIGRDSPDIPDERIAVKRLVDCTQIYALTAAPVCGVA